MYSATFYKSDTEENSDYTVPDVDWEKASKIRHNNWDARTRGVSRVRFRAPGSMACRLEP